MLVASKMPNAYAWSARHCTAEALICSLWALSVKKSFVRFEALPALLVLVPAHLSSSGALGGILSGRLSSKLLSSVSTRSADR